MAHIIRPLHAFSRKRGVRVSVINAPRLFSQFFPIKTCAVSAKRSHRSLVLFCCRKSEASARLRQISWQKFYPPTLHRSPTPRPSQSLTRSIKLVPNRIQFFSRVHYISPGKRSRICVGNRPRSKNARSEFSENEPRRTKVVKTF